MKNSKTRLASTCGLLITGLLANLALAQESNSENATYQNRLITIKPRATLTETWSDNVAISSTQNSKDSGLITEIAPGIRIDAKTARLKAYFDYSLHELIYSNGGNNRSQNSLNTFGTLEAISNWLFVDFSGIIAQQTISAFGPQSTSNVSVNSNSTETSSYRLSPYIRGRLGASIEYLLRYNWSTTRSNASTASNTELSGWTGQLRGNTAFKNLGWTVDANQQTSDYSQGRTYDDERLSATATYTIIPQFRVSLSGGRESNNYASQSMESATTHGYGFDWSPTERTQISAFKEHRFFGDGHRYSISHRFPLSSIRYTDTRDVSVLPNQFTSVGLGTVYGLFYQICSQQLSTNYPDPIQLDQAASTCATNLVSQSGIPANTQVTSSFLSSRATIQRNQQLALALQGVRNTLTLILNRNESQSILANNAFNDDFSQNNTNDIRQRGVTINLSHHLSEHSSLNLTASRQESTGGGSNTSKTSTTMYQVNLISRLSIKTTGGLSIRHTDFDSNNSPYKENAVIGTVTVLF